MEAERKPIDPYITWASDYCKHCYTCINICPVKNLKFKKDEMFSLGKCIQCQLCMKYCPDFALEVVPKPLPKAKAKSQAETKAKIESQAESSTMTKPKARAKNSKKARNVAEREHKVH